MAETLILKAAVVVATVYENTARGSGKPFWNVVTDAKDRFTAFSREIVAPLINGRPSTVITGRDGGPDSLAYNLNPPLNTVVFFEARATGKILVPTPEGTPEPPATQVTVPAQGSGSATTQTPPVNPTPTPQPPYKPPYKPYGGGQKSGGSWKPRDERPGLVTMTQAYGKDIVVAIVANSADLKLQDADKVVVWATQEALKLSKILLDYSLAEVKALGFKLDPEGGAK